MGFTSVYGSLTEIFPQIDKRILRAVAIEHPKDADEAAAVVLSEIVPSLPSNSSRSLTQPLNKSSGSISELKEAVERDLEDVVSKCRGFLVASGSNSSTSSSSSSETIPLVVTRGPHTSATNKELASVTNELKILPLPVGQDGFHKDVDNEEVQSMKKAPGKEHENYDFFGDCFDVPSDAQIGLHVPQDDVASAVSAVAKEYYKSASGFWQDLDLDMTWNQTELSTSRGSELVVQKLLDLTPEDNITNVQQGSCSEVGSGSRNAVEETLKESLASENDDTELGGAFSTSTHGCNVDHLEEIIEEAKSNKKTLLTVMEFVMNLMREVEIEEKSAEKSKEEAAKGGLDTLEKVENLKTMLAHAKEANDMHAGEVYGEKSILAYEVKELENRLLNLSEERNKSLALLDAMRDTLEIRLDAAFEMKKAAAQEKKEKEDSALKVLAEQEAIMEKVVQESKLLQQEAEENSKLREFLMDRGQIVDSLQGEISVICQDVKNLKEKFDNRESLTKSISSNQSLTKSISSVSSSQSSLTGSISSKFARNLMLEKTSNQWDDVPETSSNNKIPEEEAAAASSMKEEKKDDRRELLEDGWDIFDKEFEL